MKTYYAPTFIDESRTFPNKKGESRPTGVLRGMIMTRRFYLTPKKKIAATRGVVPFSWLEDTVEAKTESLRKAVKGMEELPELDENPPLDFIPEVVNSTLSH